MKRGFTSGCVASFRHDATHASFPDPEPRINEQNAQGLLIRVRGVPSGAVVSELTWVMSAKTS